MSLLRFHSLLILGLRGLGSAELVDNRPETVGGGGGVKLPGENRKRKGRKGKGRQKERQGEKFIGDQIDD